jgi:hypothetical protein
MRTLKQMAEDVERGRRMVMQAIQDSPVLNSNPHVVLVE